MIVGPASSYWPLLSASSDGRVAAHPVVEQRRPPCASSAFGAGPVCSTWLTTGHTGERTSSVAARFITLTSSASVTFCGNWSNSSTRCTEPYGSSSPCMNPGADWLFQLSSRPSGVVSPCGCSFPRRKPRHSYCPVPSVGSRRSRPGARTGQQPRREVRGRVVRRVRPVEREAELVGDVVEALRRRRLALGEVLQRAEVEAVAAERRPLARERDRPAVRRRGPDHRAVHRHRVPDRRAVERAGVERGERPAHAVEEVVVRGAGRRRAVGVAQLLGEDVAHVVVRRREAPRVVVRAPDEDVHHRRGHADALRLDARAA